jgi:hypothetical protein
VLPYYPLVGSPTPLGTTEELTVSLTVAGDLELTAGAAEDGWQVEGRTVHFEGLLDRRHQMAVALPEATAELHDIDGIEIVAPGATGGG